MTFLIVGIAVFVCTASALLSIASVFRITGRPEPEEKEALPLSVLKPLCGADESLEANLETFFLQDHPDFELVFGVERESDPAIPIVRRLMSRHPAVCARLVVHGRSGLNPKVANLRGILASGSRDLLVISDSNIAVGPHYLSRLAARFTQPDARGEEPGLVTSLFAGVGAQTVGARLECLQLCGAIAGGIATSEVVSRGHAFLVGKSMMFRRSLFEKLGGLESLSGVLAEDYVMGRMYKEAGYQVRVSSEVVHNVTVTTTPRGFLDRQIRWATLRSRLKPLLYPFELLLNPSAVALVGMLAGGRAWLLAWAFGLSLLRDGLQWWRLRGGQGISAALLGVPKDLLLVAVWAIAPFVTTVRWRGNRIRISAGTRVYRIADAV